MIANEASSMVAALKCRNNFILTWSFRDEKTDLPEPKGKTWSDWMSCCHGRLRATPHTHMEGGRAAARPLSGCRQTTEVTVSKRRDTNGLLGASGNREGNDEAMPHSV